MDAGVSSSRRERLLQGLCVMAPLCMLAANALAWLRYGTDMPFIDDWRAYRDGTIDSFALSRLFQVVNNTLSPVGFALDTLAQRTLDGNSIAYQLLSMLAVLGGLLWLQWRLLGWALADGTARAVAFAATVFMLQSGSYWGEQNLAYHQALPLVFLFGAAAVVLPGRIQPRVCAAAALGLGVLAGLSYVSGAIATLMLGAGWVAMSFITGHDRALAARARMGGGTLALAGLLTTAVQLYFTRVAHGDDPALRYRLTWPDQPEFWAFLLGKMGRAFGHALAPLGLELGFVLVASFGFAASVCWLLWRFVQATGSSASERVAYLYLPLAAIVAVYLLLVALGRTSVRDPGIQGGWAVFQFAYHRFHFFWVTLLLPWLVAAGFAAGSVARGRERRTLGALTGLLLALLALGGVRGVFNVGVHYADNARFRAGEIRCLNEQLGAGGPIQCPSFDMPDWTPAYLYARRINASFIKYFPVVAQQPSPKLLLDWKPGAGGAEWHDMQPLGDGWWQGADDPWVVLTAGSSAEWARCDVVALDVRLASARDDMAQVFFLPRGQREFTPEHSAQQRYRVPSSGVQDLRFTLDSIKGLENRIRIDPGDAQAQVRLERVRATCLLARQ